MLGDSGLMLFDAAWHRDPETVINEAVVRKLMSGQRVSAQRQYWLVFDDADTMRARLAGLDGAARLEERQPDCLSPDWQAHLERAQSASQALVIVAVRDRPMFGCLFAVGTGK